MRVKVKQEEFRVYLGYLQRLESHVIAPLGVVTQGTQQFEYLLLYHDVLSGESCGVLVVRRGGGGGGVGSGIYRTPWISTII